MTENLEIGKLYTVRDISMLRGVAVGPKRIILYLGQDKNLHIALTLNGDICSWADQSDVQRRLDRYFKRVL